jgi:3-oxoacyl-[acyl-carrier protein] reductase
MAVLSPCRLSMRTRAGVAAAVSKFAYAAAKAGIIGMTRSLAKELGPNILVNCVCPGLIKTEVSGNAVIREREPELIKEIARKRVGMPHDVAEVVAFVQRSQKTSAALATGQNCP